MDKFSTFGILEEILGIKNWWITCRKLSKKEINYNKKAEIGANERLLFEISTKKMWKV